MKMMGAAEFKTHCLRILDEVNETGEPVTITKRGKVVAVVSPRDVKPDGKLPPLLGALKSDAYSFPDPFSPIDDWPSDEEFDKEWSQYL